MYTHTQTHTAVCGTYSCHSWGTARTAAPSNHCLIDLLEQRWPLCFHLYAWRFPEAVHPPIFRTSFPSPFLPFTLPRPCCLNPTLNYPTTGSQCSEMDLIIRISAGEVHLGTAAFSTATRRRVLVAGGAMGPLRPNCFRQVKETGGRMCSCASHVPGSGSAGIVSRGRRDTAAIFRVCSIV